MLYTVSHFLWTALFPETASGPEWQLAWLSFYTLWDVFKLKQVHFRTAIHEQSSILRILTHLSLCFWLFLSFPTVTCPMNEVLTASTGVIMSQSPGSGFPHFESCSWVVKVEPGYNITFTIEHFQTSRQFDELEIFDGESLYKEVSL